MPVTVNRICLVSAIASSFPGIAVPTTGRF